MLPPQKRLCINLGPRFEVGKSSSAPTARPTGGFRADYGLVGTLDDEIRRDPKREVGYGITYTKDEMVEDMQGTPAATDVARLSQRMTDFVMTIRQDTDEIYRRLDDAHDDRLSREAWVQSMDASDTARSKMAVLQSQQTPARDLAHPDILEEAGKNGTKRTTRSTPVTTTTPINSVNNEQLKRLIDQGIADALAARDADRS
ncbi:hypothetical protein Tco_1533750 [Tanacetum coccineum]